MKRYIFRLLLVVNLFIILCCDASSNINNIDFKNINQGRINLGQSLYNSQNWDAAIDIFEEALSFDSTNSEVYYWLMKSYRERYQLTVAFKEVDEFVSSLRTISGAQTPFFGFNENQISFYLKGASLSQNIYSMFYHRDTLTQLKNKYDLIQSNQVDSTDTTFLTVQQREFISNYIKNGNANVAGYYPESAFPLLKHNEALGFRKQFDEHVILYSFLFFLLHYRDLDQNNFISSEEYNSTIVTTVNDALKGSLTSFSSLFASSLNSTKADSEELALLNAVQINKSLEVVFNDGQELLNFMIMIPNTLRMAQSRLESVINELPFYSFFDNIDNDGDGCVDEEIIDSVDNDGDNLIDEDTRIKYPFVNGLQSEFKKVGGVPGTTAQTSISFLDLGLRISFLRDNLGSDVTTQERNRILKLIKNQQPPYVLSLADLQQAKEKIGLCWKLLY